MSNLVEEIINKDLNKANEILKEALNQKALYMLEEIKKMLAAEQFTDLEEDKEPTTGTGYPASKTLHSLVSGNKIIYQSNKLSELEDHANSEEGKKHGWKVVKAKNLKESQKVNEKK